MSRGVATGSSSSLSTGRHLNVATVERLTDVTWRIRQAWSRRASPAHGGEIDHIELYGPPTVPGADSKSFVLCPGRAYDRSPCGTGTSAKIACLFADGKLTEGAVWRQESSSAACSRAGRSKPRQACGPRFAARAYVNAESTLIVDPADPFALGIRP